MMFFIIDYPKKCFHFFISKYEMHTKHENGG